MSIIERMEQLNAAATAGPFTMMGPRTDETATVEYDHVCLVTTPPRDGMVEIAAICDDEDRARLFAESRNALPALLAVAKAAKLVKAANARRANAQVQDCCVREDYEQSMGHACDQLTRALEQLEATP